MIITLLTDFGLQDAYVGIMKGVIKTINPDVDLIDLTHNIEPQNLFSASFILQNSIDFFPSDSIHLIVVDPGVGSDRNAIIMICKQGYFICPDNGILTGVLSRYKPQKIYRLTNSNYWLSNHISNTFHGRDIFAPVAAHLANGNPLENFGAEINPDELIQLDLPQLEIHQDKIIGAVQYIDIYGNLITNIPASILDHKSWYAIEKNIKINNCRTYSNVPKSNLVALIGSHGYLEIAVNGGSAKTMLNKNYGDLIAVNFNKN